MANSIGVVETYSARLEVMLPIVVQRFLVTI